MADQGTVVTYTDADGGTEDVWVARDGPVPPTITLAGGTTGYLTLPEETLSTTPGAPGMVPGMPTVSDDPPPAMRQVVNWSPRLDPLPAQPGTRVRLGYPGMPFVVDADSPVAIPSPDPSPVDPPIMDEG